MTKEMLEMFGLQGLFLLAVAWFVRSTFLKYLDKDVEQYKTRLKQEALEHEIQYRRVDERVADALSEIFANLHNLFEAGFNYAKMLGLKDGPSREELYESVRNANHSLNSCLYNKNRLYIPPKLFEKVEKVQKKLAENARGLSFAENVPPPSDHEDPWMKAYKEFQLEINPIFSEIVAEFQNRLGVNDEIKKIQ